MKEMIGSPPGARGDYKAYAHKNEIIVYILNSENFSCTEYQLSLINCQLCQLSTTISPF